MGRFRWLRRNIRGRKGYRAPGGDPVNSVPASIVAADGAFSGWDLTAGHIAITPGTWSNSPTLTYTLRRAGAAVVGLTGVSKAVLEAHVFVEADIGPSLTVDEIPNAVTASAVASNAIAWSPARDTACISWLGETFVEVSGRISEQTDLLTGAPYSATQATAVNRPKKTTVAGRPMVDYSDVVADAQYLDTPAFTQAQGLTVISVHFMSLATGADQRLWGSLGASAGPYVTASWAGTDDFRIRAGGTERLSTGGLAAGIQALAAVFNGASSLLYKTDFRTGAAIITGLDPGSTGISGGLRYGQQQTLSGTTLQDFGQRGHTMVLNVAATPARLALYASYINFLAYTSLTVLHD